MSTPLYIGPLLHLRTLPAFVDLSPRQLRDLAYEAEEVVLDREAELIRAGEAAAAMYLVVDGVVDIGGGRELVRSGGVVGFLESLASSPARFPAVAETEVMALRIEADSIRDVCEQNFPVLAALLAHVANRVAQDRWALEGVVSGPPGAVPAEEGHGRVGRMLALRKASALMSPHLDALAELAGLARSIRVDRGEELWVPGEAATRFFVVCSGAVRLSLGSVGDELDLGVGAVPGLVEILGASGPASRATATEPSVLLSIDSEPFVDVLEDHFEMAFDLLAWLTRSLLESGERASGG